MQALCTFDIKIIMYILYIYMMDVYCICFFLDCMQVFARRIAFFHYMYADLLSLALHVLS